MTSRLTQLALTVTVGTSSLIAVFNIVITMSRKLALIDTNQDCVIARVHPLNMDTVLQLCIYIHTQLALVLFS